VKRQNILPVEDQTVSQRGI